ncbi:Low choriolytic enzyme [Stylophora pistillata]|uniref:Metalloendopeptidase n=1 Tax=Stylophora pistillata TaxID=50429 RepID=A0A2B4SKI6_STYPI|nr:Low choriolytic enzyme [Stylophora pistillata]
MKLYWVPALSLAYLIIFLVLQANAKATRHLYEEDLLLTSHRYKELKTGVHGQKRGFTPGRVWPDGKIPFVVDKDLERSYKASETIAEAMKEWTDKSCVKFVPRSSEKVYLHIVNDDKERCASTGVGFEDERYWLLLAPRCWWKGMVIHELGRGIDFDRQNDSDTSSYITPYDYSSIMHYGDGFASKNDEKTLVPKHSGVTIGHWEKLSEIDIQQVNLHYNCPADSYTYERFICQDKRDSITCYGGRKIKIIRAYYGRKKAFKCGFGMNTNCEAMGSEAKVITAERHSR